MGHKNVFIVRTSKRLGDIIKLRSRHHGTDYYSNWYEYLNFLFLSVWKWFVILFIVSVALNSFLMILKPSPQRKTWLNTQRKTWLNTQRKIQLARICQVKLNHGGSGFSVWTGLYVKTSVILNYFKRCCNFFSLKTIVCQRI